MNDSVPSQPQPSPRSKFSRRAIVPAAVAAVLAIAGGLYIVAPKRSVSTDNAYLQADSAIISPKVRGLVSRVLVEHNQPVQAGDVLVEINPEEFDARVAAASADLQSASANVESARAVLISLTAEEQLAASNVHSAQVSIRSAEAQRDLAHANRERYDSLVDSGSVARLEVDQFRAAAVTAEVGAQTSVVALEVSQNQAAVTRAKRAVLQANLSQALAAVSRAQAAFDLAKQDQEHATLRAPIDGVVGDRRIEVGDYVAPGTRLMTIVPMEALYVVANFKETQTDRMTAGQSASIEVDALPGVSLRGEVDSFAPGSGSQFSLLPFEPGTGNFTKVVQRVPVRIRFEPGQMALAKLRPGLSTKVSVRLVNDAQSERRERKNFVSFSAHSSISTPPKTSTR
ncbi:MAG: HlyD family secretion protein [Gammaproteobacteria bacterium]